MLGAEVNALNITEISFCCICAVFSFSLKEFRLEMPPEILTN